MSAAGSLPAPSGEETLDAEWTSGIAQGATIRIYASGSLAFADLDRAIDQIIADLPTSAGDAAALHQPGAGRILHGEGRGDHPEPEVFAAGGGGRERVRLERRRRLQPELRRRGDGGEREQVEYGSSDPSVIGVGGTSLVLAYGWLGFQRDGLAGQRRRDEQAVSASGVADGRGCRQRQVPAGARRQLQRRPERRRVCVSERPGAADRRHQLGRADLGGVLRADQPGPRRSPSWSRCRS